MKTLLAKSIKDIRQLKGPILVLGAGGFIGANIFHTLVGIRDDVYAGVNNLSNWRLKNVSPRHIVRCNILDKQMVSNALELTGARTIFYTPAYGAYSFETDYEKIQQINYNSLLSFLELVDGDKIAAVIHAGSSSEYGTNSAAPSEEDPCFPNSQYAISKCAAAAAIKYYGTVKKLPVINLRIYSAYGPLEDSARLVPNLVRLAKIGEYPKLSGQNTSRDFIFISDVVDAFVRAALVVSPNISGNSYNIGTGDKTTLIALTKTAAKVFKIRKEPEFGSYPGHHWDVEDWYANIAKATAELNWRPKITLSRGLELTAEWQQNFPYIKRYWSNTKSKTLRAEKNSISAIIACYKDAEAIPIMYERLKATFHEIGIDYQIIFVNDCSPDETEAAICSISKFDPKVLGISHSRNFGSQMAFRSGMEIAEADACVLLDGDLQDPPEVIKQFVEKWREGFDVVFGHRIQREMNVAIHALYKLFYYVFAKSADFEIPRDSGDFSLIDKKVINVLLRSPERDLFLRGLRAFVGFKQTGVEYYRPERMFGKSTNNFFKNVSWAKKAIFSYSTKPIDFLTSSGIALFGLSIILMMYVVINTIISDKMPSGIPTTVLLILFFGGLNTLGLAILGEYIGKIITEVKMRPQLIRRAFIKDGTVIDDIEPSRRIPR